MVDADLSRIINSYEIQFFARPIKKKVKSATLKKNPLKNINVMIRLNVTLLAEVECLSRGMSQLRDQ